MLGGSLPVSEDGKFRFVSLITKHGTYHYRATFGAGDYGAFCDAELAAFVANYGRLHVAAKTREDCWKDLGIVNLNEHSG